MQINEMSTNRTGQIQMGKGKDFVVWKYPARRKETVKWENRAELKSEWYICVFLILTV